jgi:site-specific recombinase XerD
MEINKDECPYYLNEYIFYMKVIKGRSERTIEAYYIDLRLFLRYIKLTKYNLPADADIETISIKDLPAEILKQITLNDAIEFLYYTSSERDNHAATRARKASSLKSFFNYLFKNTNLIDKNPVKDLELPSLKKALPKFLTLEESLELLNNIKSSNPVRDYCIITLFLNCGMRLSELVGLNIKDINLNEKTMRLLGKGNKERIIYINEACVDALKNYLKSRESSVKDPNALFLSSRGTRINKRRVQQIVEECLKHANLDGKGISTHKLRHTAATLMYQHGNVDTLVLKEILGHKSIATTEIYTHLSDEKLKKAADSSPLANVKKITKG